MCHYVNSKVMLTMKGIGMSGDEVVLFKFLLKHIVMIIFITGAIFLSVVSDIRYVSWHGNNSSIAILPSNYRLKNYLFWQLAALLMHDIVVRFKIPFPGYPGYFSRSEGGSPKELPPAEPIPMWKLAVLIIPSVFDLTASALAMFGLRHVDVSIYQMLRGLSCCMFLTININFIIINACIV